jgi:hypothetical protein
MSTRSVVTRAYTHSVNGAVVPKVLIVRASLAAVEVDARPGLTAWHRTAASRVQAQRRRRLRRQRDQLTPFLIV